MRRPLKWLTAQTKREDMRGGRKEKGVDTMEEEMWD